MILSVVTLKDAKKAPFPILLLSLCMELYHWKLSSFLTPLWCWARTWLISGPDPGATPWCVDQTWVSVGKIGQDYQNYVTMVQHFTDAASLIVFSSRTSNNCTVGEINHFGVIQCLTNASGIKLNFDDNG